jgi:hypothetical protein
MIYNPFMPYKHLRSRGAGLIVFKGGGGGAPAPVQIVPPTVVDGGLSDEQYNKLMSGIGSAGAAGVDGADGTAATGLYNEASTIGTNMDTGFAGIGTRLDGVNTNATANRDAVTANTNTGFTNLTALLNDYNTAQNQRFDATDTGLATNASGINNLQTSQDTGFGAMGDRFDTVDQANTTLQNDMTTGFQDTGTSLSNMNTSMDTQFSDAQTDRDASFADARTNMETGFQEVGDTLATNEAARAAGINAIAGDVDAFSGRADAYATQSLQNQDTMMGNQDGFVSSFDNYVDRYTDDVELAGQGRAELLQSAAGQNRQLRDDLGVYAQAASIGQQNLSDQFAARQGGFQQTNQATADVYGGIEASQIVEGRNIARQAANIPSLDANMRMEFGEIGAAFDDNGQLIESTINSNGIRTNRRMDDRGNLILDQFNQQGQGIGRMNINIDQSINNLRSLAAIT